MTLAVAAAAVSLALGATRPSSASAPAEAGTDEPRAARVYAWDANQDAGGEWSDANTDATPKGQRKFLGPFRNQTVSLQLKDLPPHKMLRVSFDLFIIMTWDGASEGPGGPDLWQLAIAKGPRILRTSFEYSGSSAKQSFPGEYPGDESDGGTAAAETETLGYRQGPSYPPGKFADQVYRLSFTLPHTPGSVQLDFTGDLKGAGTDETWGLTNVVVEVLEAPRKVAAKDLERLWADLDAEDPAISYEATWALVGAGEEARRFLAGKVAPEAVDANAVAALVRQLDSDEWRDREAATKALAKYSAAARPLLTSALENARSEEVKTRLKTALEEMAKQESPRLRRAIRALDLLAWEDPPAGPAPATRPAS